MILQTLYSKKYNIIICGDVNVNYLIGNKGRSQLDAVLHSYNLAGIFKFPTRFGLNSHTVIDSVFTDTTTTGKYDLYPLINGLSDHDAQLLILNKGWKKEKECHTYIKRKINKYITADFQLKLCHETWELVFDGNDVNKIFISFLNIFLTIYYSRFPLIQAKNGRWNGSMECKCTTRKEIVQIIKSLKIKNSYGYKEISTKILKISCPFTSSPLNYTCNKIIFWGIFPERLRYAVIKPQHKNSDGCEVSIDLYHS